MKFSYIITGILIAVLSYFVWQQFIRDDFSLSRGGDTVPETVIVRDGEVIDDPALQEELRDMLEKRDQFMETDSALENIIEKEIMVTDGVKHSVSLDEILSGGPPKDGIPPIDDPKFVTPEEASDWLDDGEPGIAFSRDGVNRFYPYQILVWHEIVNDMVGDERILVTYCPLCLTGFVFDPVVQGERVEFGTSGRLWKSNLVMYDRKTDSLWPQVLGEAVVGPMTGTELPKLPSDQVLFGKWKEQFPNGKVLSRDTGATRFYGSNPYDDYFSVSNLSLSLVNPTDTRLPNDALVFGIVERARAKAYHLDAVIARGEVTDTFAGTTFVLRHEQELDVVRVFRKLSDGSEERVNPFSSFWFSWAAAHPETDLFK